MEVPAHNEESGPIIITGVESENIEEINDAYGDMITDMGETSKNNILARAVGVAVGCPYVIDWQQYYCCVHHSPLPILSIPLLLVNFFYRTSA